jgi:1,2-diacylglycerol 3-beta-galactosyltransferase
MKPDRSKRIVILTADAGFGHRKAANAVAAALQEACGDACSVEIVNPLDDPRVLPLLRNSQADSDRFARDMREVFDRGWNASRAAVPTAGLGGALTVVLFNVMRDILRTYRPDAIINTYPLYHPPLANVFRFARRRTPLYTVVTDFGIVHSLWFSRAADTCFVATEKVRQLAIAHGLPPEKVLITGIPVAPALADRSCVPAEMRAALGWDLDLPVILAVGSKRVQRLPDFLRILNHSALPLQLAVVAGGDDELYAELQRFDWHRPAYLYNWVEDMPALMHAADCVMSKAGGLIIAETLACGLPLLLIDVLPAQEKGNVDIVLQSGAGELALSPGDALEVLYHWLAEDGALLAQRAANARAVGRPRAAFDIAEFVVSQIQGLPS